MKWFWRVCWLLHWATLLPLMAVVFIGALAELVWDHIEFGSYGDVQRWLHRRAFPTVKE